MALIETKYSIGDAVFGWDVISEQQQLPCPDCLGEKKWKTTSPAGTDYTFSCPRCSDGFKARYELSLVHLEWRPIVECLTIGSVKVDHSSEEKVVSYMCVETGIGSGRVYKEDDFYSTRELAMAHAEFVAKSKNEQAKNDNTKKFMEFLAVSDYQLDNATLEIAKNVKRDAENRSQDLIDALDTNHENSEIIDEWAKENDT